MSTSDHSPIVNYDIVVTFSGSTTSNVVDLNGCAPVGIVPATGMTTASYTLQAAPTASGTQGNVQDQNGTAIGAASVAANAFGDLGSNFPLSTRFVRLVSSVSQTGTAIIVTRPV